MDTKAEKNYMYIHIKIKLIMRVSDVGIFCRAIGGRALATDQRKI